MLEGREMIGMPVVTSDTGEEIGRVKDVIVHRTKKCVVGFLLRRGGWFQHARVVPYSQVMSFDKSAVMVPAAASVMALEQVPDVSRLLERKPVIGSSLISSNGHEIGQICDFYFDEQSGRIDGLEVVKGIAPDELSDPQYVPLDENIFVGREDFVLSEHAAERPVDGAIEIARRNPIPEDSPLIASSGPPTVPQTGPVRIVKPTNPNPLKMIRDGSTMIIGFNTNDIPDDLCIAGYHKELLRLLAENETCDKLVFDVTNIKLLPSSMLGLLASLRKKVGNLEILNPSPGACEALKILGFDKYMTIVNASSD